MGYRYAYHDDPVEEIEPQSSRLGRALFILATIAILGTAGSTLAANLSLNSSGSTEFGQGLLKTTACSGSTQLSMKPASYFDGSNYLLKSITVSNVPSQCAGNDFSFSEVIGGKVGGLSRELACLLRPLFGPSIYSLLAPALRREVARGYGSAIDPFPRGVH